MVPKTLIDTDILSAVIRGDPRVAPRELAYRVDHPRMTVSAFNLFEIQRGLLAKGAIVQLREFAQHRAVMESLPIDRRLVEAHRALRPELVLVIRGSWVDAETLSAMAGSTRAVWFQDMVHRSDAPPGLMQVADKVFVFEGSDVRRTREEQGVESHFLPMGFDPKDYRPIPGVERDIDVSFVGMPYPERQVILDRLLADFPGRRFRFVGRYVRYREPRTWLKYVERKLDGPARRAYRNGEVSPSAVNQLYARSKVVLNIHHKQSQEGLQPAGLRDHGLRRIPARRCQRLPPRPFHRDLGDVRGLRPAPGPGRALPRRPRRPRLRGRSVAGRGGPAYLRQADQHPAGRLWPGPVLSKSEGSGKISLGIGLEVAYH